MSFDTMCTSVSDLCSARFDKGAQLKSKNSSVFASHAMLIGSARSTIRVSTSRTFFENEPVPLASSVVDDLTTLGSTIYLTSLILIVFVLLAWITHYHAPCSSLITSIFSTITGLPVPLIHSLALCGSCCLWCERTWLFRRIHQFNLFLSNKISAFLSGTCKLFYDTLCPCCRPPDTPSNRSIIGKNEHMVFFSPTNRIVQAHYHRVSSR